MFGPNSYHKTHGDVDGFRVAFCAHNLEIDTYERRKILRTRLGRDIVEMTADEHDRHVARTLFLTHLISQAMTYGGFTRTEIDTISFRSLMNVIENVRGNKELFLDVYTYNRHCKEVLSHFGDSVRVVERMLNREDEAVQPTLAEKSAIA